jgi:hypothetical protein
MEASPAQSRITISPPHTPMTRSRLSTLNKRVTDCVAAITALASSQISAWTEYWASQMFSSVRWHTQSLASSSVIDLLSLSSIESLE